MNKDYYIKFGPDDIRLSGFFRDSGEQLIFFIHGMGASKESFKEAFDDNYLPGFSLLAIDLPGFGDSDAPSGFSYSMEDYTSLCVKLLDSLPNKKTHIVAHSMGGAIALMLVEQMKEKPLSFVNIEGNLIPEDCGIVSRLVVEVSFDDFKNKVFAQMRERFSEIDNIGVKLWLEQSAKADLMGFHRASKSLVELTDRGDLIDMFHRLQIPKIYFHGEENTGIPVISRLKDVDIVSISKSNHSPMNDNPQEFYMKLDSFLKSAV